MIKNFTLTSSSWFSSTVMSWSIFDDIIFQSNIIAICMMNHNFNNDFDAIFLLYKREEKNAVFSLKRLCINVLYLTFHSDKCSKCQNGWSCEQHICGEYSKMRRIQLSSSVRKVLPICIHTGLYGNVCFWMLMKWNDQSRFIH